MKSPLDRIKLLINCKPISIDVQCSRIENRRFFKICRKGRYDSPQKKKKNLKPNVTYKNKFGVFCTLSFNFQAELISISSRWSLRTYSRIVTWLVEPFVLKHTWWEAVCLRFRALSLLQGSKDKDSARHGVHGRAIPSVRSVRWTSAVESSGLSQFV